MQTIRAFFIAADFLEVETPQRIPVNAPEAHILPITSGRWQLQTSPELAMKRLLSAGYNRIFQISHCWRDEERGNKHLPEFSLLEWYRAHCDYTQLMLDCENLFRTLLPQNMLVYQDHTVEIGRPFERLCVDQAFLKYTETTAQQALADNLFDELMAFNIEPQLGFERPVILYDYPIELGALARRKPDQPEIAERFELYIAGLELANAFSELNDPVEQHQRFDQVAAVLTRKTGQPVQLPTPFLEDLHLLPPAAGIALGIDRLVMLLTNSQTIDQVVPFTPDDL